MVFTKFTPMYYFSLAFTTLSDAIAILSKSLVRQLHNCNWPTPLAETATYFLPPALVATTKIPRMKHAP